jgi:hypothetical protein
MQSWRMLTGLLGGIGLGAGLMLVWHPSPLTPPDEAIVRQLEQQTALLAWIVGVLERWEAEEQAAKAAAEERSRRVMEQYRTGGPTKGLQELPKTLEKQP